MSGGGAFYIYSKNFRKFEKTLWLDQEEEGLLKNNERSANVILIMLLHFPSIFQTKYNQKRIAGIWQIKGQIKVTFYDLPEGKIQKKKNSN
jgi:hypothetical protein